MTYVKIGLKEDIPVGTGKRVNYGETSIAIFHIDGTFYAIDNQCQHAGGSLGEGTVKGEVVTCPLHQWKYNVTTGRCNTVPMVPLKTYDIKLEGEEILVRMKPD